MATVTRGETFAADATVQNTDLHNLVDNATVTLIDQNDMGANVGTVVSGGSAPADTDALWRDTTNGIIKYYNPLSSAWQPLSPVTLDNKNVVITRPTTNTTNITADILTVEDQLLTSVDLTGTMSSDLDTGSEAPSTWYSKIVAVNPTTGAQKIVFSTTQESSNLPSGYTKQRHVAWIYNDSSSNFDSDRLYDCFTNYNSFKTRTFVSITTAGTQNYDISAYIPPSTYSVTLVLKLTTTGINSNATFFSVGGDSASAQSAQVNTNVANQVISASGFAGVNSSGNVTYILSVSGALTSFIAELNGFFQTC